MLAAFAAALWLTAFAAFHDHHALAQLNVAQLNVQPPQAGHQLSPQQPPQAQPQPSAGAQPAPPQAPPKKEGFFDAVGKWWDQSAADFDANLKKMKTQIEEANDRNAKTLRDVTQGAAAVTKDATDALAKLPSTRIIEGRERCVIAPNGSPDCVAAAETLCKAKGFKSGSSANIESARKCSARAFLSRDEKDCVNEP
ncbi:MAG: hypothetical protein ABUL48_04190, partial [Pseudorhodoplanes sp.]